VQKFKTKSVGYTTFGRDIVVKDERGKTFSCLKCGAMFIGYPPDDFHQTASVKSNGVEDPIKVEYKCPSCGNMNGLYWGWEKMDVDFG